MQPDSLMGREVSHPCSWVDPSLLHQPGPLVNQICSESSQRDNTNSCGMIQQPPRDGTIAQVMWLSNCPVLIRRPLPKVRKALNLMELRAPGHLHRYR
jgi:hypothetical protein